MAIAALHDIHTRLGTQKVCERERDPPSAEGGEGDALTWPRAGPG